MLCFRVNRPKAVAGKCKLFPGKWSMVETHEHAFALLGFDDLMMRPLRGLDDKLMFIQPFGPCLYSSCK
jgi:hypothetical protein